VGGEGRERENSEWGVEVINRTRVVVPHISKNIHFDNQGFVLDLVSIRQLE